jgi:hypothetical protein
MNRLGAIVVFAGGLALTIANAQAEPTATNTAGGPYAPAAASNVFGLTSPPSAPLNPQVGTPPPKITLTGVTTIVGPAEALFKVEGGERDGKPCPDKSYLLKEGQEEDGVAIVAIDLKKSVVTFNNHGVRQDIALTHELPVQGKSMVADEVTNLPAATNLETNDYQPKPSDFDYADEKTVTAPLPPGEGQSSQSTFYDGGIGGDTPPGHGGF